MYDIYIYTYIYQTRLTAFKLLRPMSSAPARGSELLESVEDLKEEEVEDGKTHSHMGIELHLHVSFLGVAAWVSCDVLWKGNCFQASHRPFELLWFVDHGHVQTPGNCRAWWCSSHRSSQAADRPLEGEPGLEHAGTFILWWFSMISRSFHLECCWLVRRCHPCSVFLPSPRVVGCRDSTESE